MDNHDTFARADELQILLNALADRDELLVVSYPFYNLPLLTYNPSKGTVVSSVAENDFETARAAKLPKVERLADDLPGWTDIRDALLSSGVVGYRNEAEARQRLAKTLEHAGEGHNPNPTFLALDTNTFYHRLATRGLKRILPAAPGPFQLAVSNAVVDELDASVSLKYASNDIQTLVAKLAEGRRANALLGRPYKKSRKATAGLHDARILTKTRRCVRPSSAETTMDREANDRVIAASYGRLRDETRGDVLLITSDQDMTTHAGTAGLQHLRLDLPVPAHIPHGPLDERDLCRLIHELAVSFGALRLSGAEWVWGTWSGKEPDDWESDTLRIEHGNGAIMSRFIADQKCAREIAAAMRG